MVEDDTAIIPPVMIWRVYKVPILLGSTSLLFVALSITIFIKTYQKTQPIMFSSEKNQEAVPGEATGSADTSKLMVDVEGAVVSPGVYRLAGGARVADAIAVAGGLSKQADTDAVARTLNRAAKLSDGAKLYIPAKGEVKQIVPGISGAAAAGTPFLININTASLSELDALTGVGPATANKLIAGRPYLRLEELVEKKVLTPSVFTKLKNLLTI